MTPDQTESVYEALARAIDRAAPEPPEQVLARLCLLLARALDDPAQVDKAIEAALRAPPGPDGGR
ncbi:DUF2783 domain-containing protein [Acidimangrovimonas sediminis]|uniref:DUF2783 domain-containing protein n=1 Tax=Acidimangrovimonas sediminis TaxID=2056283 RepID=UPI000C80E4C5|nr:DUF2783 domain-containing protein [Acidimangrovimonas sediminis]